MSFRSSQKQLRARLPAPSHDDLHAENDVEIVVASDWLLLFLLCQQRSSKKVIRTKAAELMQHLMSILPNTISAMRLGPNHEDGACRSVTRVDGGECVHVHKLTQALHSMRGSQWASNNASLADLLILSSLERYHCNRTGSWRRRIFDETISMLQPAASFRSDSPIGAPVLAARQKSRRLASQFLSAPLFGMRLDTRGVRVVSDSQLSGCTLGHRNSTLVGKYHAWLCDTRHSQSHLALLIDATTAGRDVVSIAWSLPVAPNAPSGWLPVKVVSGY